MASTSFFSRQRASSTLNAFVRSYPLKLNDRLSMPLRVRPFFILATLLFVSVLAVLALAPIPEIPVNDKVLHFFGNGIASLLIYPIIDPPPYPSPFYLRYSPLIATLVVSGGIMGVGSEFIQGTLSYRTFDWLDVLANLSSLVFTLPLSFWFWKNRGDSYGRLSGGGRDIWDVRDEEDLERAEAQEEEQSLLNERNQG